MVYDFEKAANEEELYAQTLDIPISDGFHESSIYLAFDYGRISVVTVSKSYGFTPLPNIINKPLR